MEQTNQMLGLLAQTSIHAGTGQQTGVIDLPIQREGHNGWPCVFGSAVKGALRARAEDQKVALLKKNDVSGTSTDVFYKKAQSSDEIAVVYGPAPGGADITHAGAIIVTDARLLLFPVRSLTSQFKWVTCPAAINRYRDDSKRLGCALAEFDTPVPEDADAQSGAIVPKQSTEDDLFLEEYRFTVNQQDLDALIASLAALMGTPQAVKSLQKQLVVVSDDSYAHIVNNSTPVNAHITIDSQTKMVANGALWYEETLPPETLLYVGLSANDGRKAGTDAEFSASKVLGHVTGLFKDKPWLQLGGNETVGMGWCSVSPIGEGA